MAAELIDKSRTIHWEKLYSALVHVSRLVYVPPTQFHHISQHYKRSHLPRYHTTIYYNETDHTNILNTAGGKRGDYRNCSVLYCVLKLCTVISTLRWAVLTVLWIGFCQTGHISVCLCRFIRVYISVYFVFFCQLHNAYMCYVIASMVGWTWWDWSVILRSQSSFSALTLLVWLFDP